MPALPKRSDMLNLDLSKNGLPFCQVSYVSSAVEDTLSKNGIPWTAAPSGRVFILHSAFSGGLAAFDGGVG